MLAAQKRVLIVAPSFETAFHAAIYKEFKKLFKPQECLFRSITGNESTQKKQLTTALEQINPGVLIAVSIRPDKSTLDLYTAANVPIILIDEEMAGLTTISTDNFIGGRIAAEYLISRGRKKIGLVCGRTDVKGGYNAAQRRNGFMDALMQANYTFSENHVVEVTNYSREEGFEAMPHFLDQGVDAIFCAAGDDCAVGLFTAAKEHGIRIPEDIAVIGFDDTLIARVSTPTLTTIRQPMDKIAETVFDICMTKGNTLLKAPHKTMFHPEIVVRNSA